jgi:hypothetical protein
MRKKDCLSKGSLAEGCRVGAVVWRVEKGCRVGAGCGEWRHWLVRAYSISSSYTNYKIVHMSAFYVAKSTSKERN